MIFCVESVLGGGGEGRWGKEGHLRTLYMYTVDGWALAPSPGLCEEVSMYDGGVFVLFFFFPVTIS